MSCLSSRLCFLAWFIFWLSLVYLLVALCRQLVSVAYAENFRGTLCGAGCCPQCRAVIVRRGWEAWPRLSLLDPSERLLLRGPLSMRASKQHPQGLCLRWRNRRLPCAAWVPPAGRDSVAARPVPREGVPLRERGCLSVSVAAFVGEGIEGCSRGEDVSKCDKIPGHKPKNAPSLKPVSMKLFAQRVFALFLFLFLPWIRARCNK